MEELELKHIAPYLPYGLKGTDNESIYTLKFGLWEHISATLECGRSIGFNFLETDFFSIKPILRPLSDLTKEIEIEGKKFVPIKILKNEYFVKEIDFFDVFNSNEAEIGIYMKSIDYTIMPALYSVYQKLFEWHFDVFGLI
jgi:hypothetical protein